MTDLTAHQPPRPPREPPEDDRLPPLLDRVAPLDREPPEERTLPLLLEPLDRVDRVAEPELDLVGVDRRVVVERERGGVDERTPDVLLVPLLERTADRVVRLVDDEDPAVVLLLGTVPRYASRPLRVLLLVVVLRVEDRVVVVVPRVDGRVVTPPRIALVPVRVVERPASSLAAVLLVLDTPRVAAVLVAPAGVATAERPMLLVRSSSSDLS